MPNVNSTAIRDPRVAAVQVSETALIVVLRDGRKISAPLAWFPRLAAAPVRLALQIPWWMPI